MVYKINPTTSSWQHPARSFTWINKPGPDRAEQLFHKQPESGARNRFPLGELVIKREPYVNMWVDETSGSDWQAHKESGTLSFLSSSWEQSGIPSGVSRKPPWIAGFMNYKNPTKYLAVALCWAASLCAFQRSPFKWRYIFYAPDNKNNCTFQPDKNRRHCTFTEDRWGRHILKRLPLQ